MKNFSFIDLFAGIGGFHQALKKNGGKCVAASEIDEECIKVYKDNFPNTLILDDITKEFDKLPKFDVLCGGFPCQPFSKAGKQDGFQDKTRGNLFYTIIEILKEHPECKFLILENVRNLGDKSENWDVIKNELKRLNFYVTDNPIILSPSQFDIPQIRERVYILGIRKNIRDKNKLPNGFIHMEDLGDIQNLPKSKCVEGSANNILEKKFPESCELSEKEANILKIWLEFKEGTNFDIPGAPIWLDFFGYNLTDEEYENKKFKHQIKDEKTGKIKKIEARINEMPNWKQNFINKNRNFYLTHKIFIDNWITKTDILQMSSIYKKFEWNCGTKNKDYKNTIIQFRQSGIRVKKNDYFPALVAINNTPIIYDKKIKRLRKISAKEAANLQSFDKNYLLPNNHKHIYKQLGNSVNVHVIEILFNKLTKFALENWRDIDEEAVEY